MDVLSLFWMSCLCFFPLWEKSYKVSGAYDGLELSGLRSKHRHKILTALQQINTIMAPYNFASFDEYHAMSDEELKSIVAWAEQLAP